MFWRHTFIFLQTLSPVIEWYLHNKLRCDAVVMTLCSIYNEKCTILIGKWSRSFDFMVVILNQMCLYLTQKRWYWCTMKFMLFSHRVVFNRRCWFGVKIWTNDVAMGITNILVSTVLLVKHLDRPRSLNINFWKRRIRVKVMWWVWRY